MHIGIWRSLVQIAGTGKKFTLEPNPQWTIRKSTMQIKSHIDHISVASNKPNPVSHCRRTCYR